MRRPSGWTLPKFSLALRLGLVLSVASPLLPAVATEAAAFEIFGIRLFGSDEAGRDVIDPLDYTITLDTGEADRALRKSLERTSLLLAEEDDPVSGDLGLVIKARDDRDRLIATLYENALYGGVVSVTIDGQDIDSLPPNPSFDRSRPVPVSITNSPERKRSVCGRVTRNENSRSVQCVTAVTVWASGRCLGAGTVAVWVTGKLCLGPEAGRGRIGPA